MMIDPVSEEVRLRLITAVEEGASPDEAARDFGVSVSSAVRWTAEFRRTGRTSPKPRGGDRRSDRIESHADFLLGAIAARPDISLSDLRRLLIDLRGETFALSTLHDFCHRHDIIYDNGKRVLAGDGQSERP